jgi:hypothetical protein
MRKRWLTCSLPRQQDELSVSHTRSSLPTSETLQDALRGHMVRTKACFTTNAVTTATMLHHTESHRRPITLNTTVTSCKTTVLRQSCNRKQTRVRRTTKLQCEAIHKEYARQGSAAQQEAPAGSSTTTGNSSLLSVPEDIVFECLTMMR